MGVRFLEIKTDVISNFHQFLQLKEKSVGVISYSYITIGIAVISLSAIVFTIVIGMMQYLINEISYQSYDKRVLKNKTTKRIFLILMGISLLLISIYIFADILNYPVTYSSILFMALLTVIALIYSLYTSLFRDFSIYSIMENNHERLLELLRGFEGDKKSLILIKEKVEKKSYKFLKKLRTKHDKYKMKKYVERMETLLKNYNSLTKSVAEELTFIVGNACKRSDSRFAKSSLEYVTKLIVHRFNAFGTTSKQHHYAYNMMGIYEQYDKFIEQYLIPIYRISNLGGVTHEIIRIANEEFGNVLSQGRILRYTDGEGYNFTFQITIALYMDNIKNQLSSGYTGVISDYRIAMNGIIQNFNITNSKELLMQISKNNVSLVEDIFRNIETVNYMHVLEVQSNILEKSILEADEYLLENVLNDIFSMFKLSIINIEKIKQPLTLQSINSYWLDTLKPSSLSIKLVWIYNNKYCEKVVFGKLKMVLSKVS